MSRNLELNQYGARTVSARIARSTLLLGSSSLAATFLCLPAARAVTIETNIPDLSIRWDNTISENILFRTENPAAVSLNSANNDDTDRNIPHGLAAARTDLTSELDIKYGDFGVRGSAFAWVDARYLGKNNNNSAATLNTEVADSQDWQRSTQQLAGYHAEIGDLFGYGSFSPTNDSKVTFRLGQFAQLWGESLYLATNGISYGMNPIDGIKGQLLLNPQARDVYMATPQVSFTYQPIAPLTFSFYYKFGFRQTRAAPVGTYFSSTDTLDTGGDRIYAPVAPGINGYLRRTTDIKPNGADGQFGVSARYNFGDYNIGIYALRFDQTNPQQVYPHPFSGAQIAAGAGSYIGSHISSGVPLGTLISQYFAANSIGTYQLAYQRGIQLYGASFDGNLFDIINVGAEMSVRHHTDLNSVVTGAQPYSSNYDSPAYAVGDTLHGQVSGIYVSPPVPLIGSDQIQITGEIGFNQLLDVTENKQALAPGVSHFASLGQLVVQASYYSVRPGIDLTPSMGIAGQICNTSAVDPGERAHTGNITVGLLAIVNQKYNFQTQYRHYMGYHSQTDPTQDNLELGRDFIGFTFSTVL